MSKLLTEKQLQDKLYEDLNLKQFHIGDATHILGYLTQLFVEQTKLARKAGIVEGVKVGQASKDIIPELKETKL